MLYRIIALSNNRAELCESVSATDDIKIAELIRDRYLTRNNIVIIETEGGERKRFMPTVADMLKPVLTTHNTK